MYSFNPFKGDVWQVGVCLICVCLLKLASELNCLFEEPKKIENLLEEINNLYG
jgi:hypothetical protein